MFAGDALDKVEEVPGLSLHPGFRLSQLLNLEAGLPPGLVLSQLAVHVSI